MHQNFPNVACWLLAVVLSAGWQPPAEAALPGRVEVADVVRLSQGDRGLVDAGGPSLEIATGSTGSFGFGAPACDEAGFTYRPTLHPRVGLTLRVPRGARRLEMIVRPAHGDREVTLTLGGRRLDSVPLSGGWQRVVSDVTGVSPGEALFELRFAASAGTPTGESDSETRALLHRIAFDTSVRPVRKAGPVDAPRTASDVLWLEAGQSILVPAPLQPEQALETSGVVTTGDVEGNKLHVDLVSAYGAAEKIITLPAVLDLPWNIDLSRRGERTPVWLRIRCSGSGSGAVGILMPHLTRTAEPGDVRAVVPPAKTVVLIGVMGLRDADVPATGGKLPLGVRHHRAWSTSPDARPALTSFTSGLSPLSHGVVGLRDAMPQGLQTIAQGAHGAGVHTILRAGFVPMTSGSPAWRGFADPLFADLRRLKPHARAVLENTLNAIVTREGPVFAMSVLSDSAPPYTPITHAWKTYYSGEEPPPWPPNASRQAVTELRSGQRPMDARTEKYLRALRRGKAHETLEQVREFQDALRMKRPDAVILVVGLGGALPGAPDGFEPADVHVPLWIDAPKGWTLPASLTVDIMDVATTAWAWAGVTPPHRVQGTDLRDALSKPWPSGAMATQTRAKSLDLCVWDDTVIMAARGQSQPSDVFLRTKGLWQREKKPTPRSGPAIDAARSHLRGWLGSGARWRSQDYEAADHRGGRDGYADPCRP